MSYFLHTYSDVQALSLGLARWMVERIENTLQTQDRFTFALSGGQTPKALYELLASDEFRNKINWSRLHLFWGDERMVPFSDERNNARMAFQTLIEKVPIPLSQVHRIDTSLPAGPSVRQYLLLLEQYFPKPVSGGSPARSFDLVLLGMGDDGHTLSLFPGTELAHPPSDWVAATFLESQSMYRVSLTPAVVNLSETVVFLAAGQAKAKTLKSVLEGPYLPEQFPSQQIRPVHGELHWFVDGPAASLLQDQTRSSES